MDTVTLCIENLQAKLDRLRKGDLKELPTRTIFVNVLLQALGWDIGNPDEVHEEYPTIDGKSVDYALKIDDKPVLFLEAKPLNDPLTDIKAITQVISYAAVAPVEWCVLTNGVIYKVYSSTEQASAPEKLLFEVSIDPKENKGMPAQEIAQCLSCLSRDSMAKSVLDGIAKETFTMRKIRKALDKIFADPSSTLIKLVRSNIRDDAIKPAQVKEALSKLWPRRTELEMTVSSPSSVPSRIKEPTPSRYYRATSDKVRPESIADVDTIVVPARKDGFNEVFLGEDRWYAIRVHRAMIPRIKYIAAYQVAPVSAITHWAPVKSVEPWPGTGKFVVNFARPPKRIGPVRLVPKGRVKALQSSRYAAFDRIQKAQTLDEVF